MKTKPKTGRRGMRTPKPIRQTNSDNPTAGLMLFLSRSERPTAGKPQKGGAA